MNILPKPAAIERFGNGVINVTIDTEGGARYFVTLMPNGGAHVEARVMRQDKPHVRAIRPGATTKKLIRVAKQMVSDQCDFAGDTPLKLAGTKVAIDQQIGEPRPAAPLILPPSPPPPPTATGYLTVMGARNLAEELLRAARQVEEAVNLVGPGTHIFVRAGAFIALRIEP